MLAETACARLDSVILRTLARPDLEKLKGYRPSKLTTADTRYCVHKITKDGLDNAVQAKKELRHNLHVNGSANTVLGLFGIMV